MKTLNLTRDEILEAFAIVGRVEGLARGLAAIESIGGGSSNGQPPAAAADVLTLEQACNLARVSPRTLRRRASAGHLATVPLSNGGKIKGYLRRDVLKLKK